MPSGSESSAATVDPVGEVYDDWGARYPCRLKRNHEGTHVPRKGRGWAWG